MPAMCSLGRQPLVCVLGRHVHGRYDMCRIRCRRCLHGAAEPHDPREQHLCMRTVPEHLCRHTSSDHALNRRNDTICYSQPCYIRIHTAKGKRSQ